MNIGKKEGPVVKQYVAKQPKPKFNNSFFSKKASIELTAFQSGFIKAATTAGLSDGESFDLLTTYTAQINK